MDAETASIVDLLCYLTILVGNNESKTTKNAGESMAISIAMAMQWYDAGCIAQWITSGASLEATGCSHRASACAVSPRRPPWSTNSLKQHKTLTKNYFQLTTYGRPIASCL
jgi:hypothetical protein